MTSLRSEEPKSGQSQEKTLFPCLLAYLQTILKLEITENQSMLRIMSRRFAGALTKDLREKSRFLAGLFAWLGFPTVIYHHLSMTRGLAGNSKYDFLKMTKITFQCHYFFFLFSASTGGFIGMVNRISVIHMRASDRCNAAAIF